MKNIQKNTRYKALQSTIKIFLMFSMAIFMLNLVSSLDFDNTLNSISQTKVEIRNGFGLTGTIAEITLKSPIKNNYIEVGKDKVVLQFEVNNFGNTYSNGLKSLKILNMVGKKEVSKEFKWVYAIYGDVEIKDYGTSCLKGSWNNTKGDYNEICNREIVSTHLEKQIIEWKEFVGTDLPKGMTTIGLMIDVNEGEHYDGIPTFFGKEITQWATWEAVVVDHSSASYGAASGDTGMWGMIVNTTCPNGIRFNKLALSTGVTANRAWIINWTNNKTLDAGNCVGEVCTFAGNNLGIKNQLYVLVGIQANNVTTWQQSQGSVTYPEIDTNINWIAGIVKYNSDHSIYTNLGFEIKNISSQCDSGISMQNITGRVVTATNTPVSGAIIVILNATGEYVANTTSNSSGYWYYSYTNGTLINYTIVGYNRDNISQGGKAYPFISQAFG